MWESEYETAEGVLYSTLVGGMNVGFVIQLNTYYKDKQPFEEFIRTIKFRYP
jgi:hypothetical protein